MYLEIIDGYTKDAATLIPAFEALSSETLLAPVIELIPASGEALDIGAGTGRDASWLAEKGFEVVAVEPTDLFRKAGTHLHSADRIEWINDSLPALSGVLRTNRRFDLVLIRRLATRTSRRAGSRLEEPARACRPGR